MGLSGRARRAERKAVEIQAQITAIHQATSPAYLRAGRRVPARLAPECMTDRLAQLRQEYEEILSAERGRPHL